MKSLLVCVALISFVCGDVSHLGYDYSAPAPVASQLSQVETKYLLPVAVESEPLVLNMYLPPAPAEIPKNTYIPPKPISAPISKPHNDYLPPVAPKRTYIPPVAVETPKITYIPPKPMSAPISKPHNDYLPPVAIKKTYIPPTPLLPPKPVTPKNTYLPPAPTQVPNNVYLPPSNNEITSKKRFITPPAPRLEDLVPPLPPQRHYEDSEILTDDGYTTVRKLKL